MTRTNTIEYEVVDLMPKNITEGVLYVSIKFCVAIHLCCCGCGNRVVTPLSPAQWSVTFDGETVSLSPSVGSHELACASHYWIRKSKVRWSRPWDAEEISDGRKADRRAVMDHFDGPRPEERLPVAQVGPASRDVGRVSRSRRWFGR
jgi:hypothetical protein